MEDEVNTSENIQDRLWQIPSAARRVSVRNQTDFHGP
jgi:hypothetical protein